MDQPIVKFVSQTPGNQDCGVVSLAMLLGLNYSEALVLVASVKPTVLQNGVEWKDLIKAARKKGVKLKWTTHVDLDDEDVTGILSVAEIVNGKRGEHAVYLTRGLIFDGRTDACYEPDVYLKVNNADVMSMLVKVSQD